MAQFWRSQAVALKDKRPSAFWQVGAYSLRELGSLRRWGRRPEPLFQEHRGRSSRSDTACYLAVIG